jgi:hypothetical protein
MDGDHDLLPCPCVAVITRRGTVANPTVGGDADWRNMPAKTVDPSAAAVKMSVCGQSTRNRRADRECPVTCLDGCASSHADMVGRCLRCRHKTEIYVRSTISTGTNGEPESATCIFRRCASCTFGTLRSC